MPEGDLLTHTVETVLRDLASSADTGCLVVRDPEGDEAEVYLRAGEVYAVSVPGRRVMLGVRLMSRGALTPEALAEALEIQRTELQGWRLGELLVHLGYVELTVVEEFVVEHLKDALADLMGWPIAAWKFRKNKKTRQDVAPPTPVGVLFDDLRDRAITWETILNATGGPDSVPTLAASSPSDEVPLGPNEWALLCKVDNARPVTELAAECGFTLFEAGQVVMRLVEAGLLAVELPTPTALVGPAPTDDAVAADTDEAAVFEDATAVEDATVAEDAGVADDVPPVVEIPQEALAPSAPDPTNKMAKRLREAELLHAEMEALAAKERIVRAERAEARRKARAAMLAGSPAAEASASPATDTATEADPEVPDGDQRAAAEDDAYSAHATWLTERRAAAEEQGWADHETFLAHETAAAEDVARREAAILAQREQAERELEAEAQRRSAEAAAARAETERLAAELAETERLAAELAETERAAAELAETERLAAEQAETERLAAELAETERVAAELAETERAAAELAETERLAAELAETERAAAELAETERAAAELAETERAAAEQAAADLAARSVTEDVTDIRDVTDVSDHDDAPARSEPNAGLLAAQAASLLTELMRDAPISQPAPEPEPEPAVDKVAEDDVPAETPSYVGPAPMVARDHADTAMLLRELSSLGFGGGSDNPAPSAPSPSAPQVRQLPPPEKKKRKGLFGRG